MSDVGGHYVTSKKDGYVKAHERLTRALVELTLAIAQFDGATIPTRMREEYARTHIATAIGFLDKGANLR